MDTQTDKEADKEMERLLRSVFAAGEASASGASADHLDVDELSAFAENALPPAARARYTVHLSDCDRCRRLVADLSGAAGVAAELEKSQAAAPAVIDRPSRDWLAKLLSWQTLRYALPIFVFMLIAGIVWQSSSQLRSRRFSPQAENRYDPSAARAPRSEVERQTGADENFNSAVGAVAPTDEPGRKNAAASELKKDSAPGGEQEKKARDAKSPPPPPSGAGGNQSARAPGRAESDETQQAADDLEQSQVFAQQTDKQSEDRDDRQSGYAAGNRRQAARPQAPASQAEQVAVAPEPSAEGNEKEEKLRDAAPRPAPREESAANKRAKAQPPAPVAGASVSGRSAAADGSKDNEKTRAAETLDVAGRRFRRQGGAWVDASYAGGAIVNIKRGSEQYRALVADEPGLRAIGDQLGGEVIVVWKNRAYRFR